MHSSSLVPTPAPDVSTFRLVTTYQHLKNETQRMLDPEPANQGTDIFQYQLRNLKTYSFFGWYNREGKVEHRSSGFRLRSLTSERVRKIIVVLESVLLSSHPQAAEAVFSLLQLKSATGQSIDFLCMYYADSEVIEKYLQLLNNLNKQGISKSRLLTLKETLYCSYSKYAFELCQFFMDARDVKKSNILRLLLHPESLPLTIKQAAALESRDAFHESCRSYFELIKKLAAQPRLQASELITLLNIKMTDDSAYSLIEYIRDEELPLTGEFNLLMATLLIKALTTEPSVDAISFKSYKEIVRDYLCRLPDQIPPDHQIKKALLAQALNPVNGLGNFFRIQRGFRETHPSRGTLYGITKEYDKILAAEAREQRSLESKEDCLETTPIITSNTSRRKSLYYKPLHRMSYGSFQDDDDKSPNDSKSPLQRNW